MAPIYIQKGQKQMVKNYDRFTSAVPSIRHYPVTQILKQSKEGVVEI